MIIVSRDRTVILNFNNTTNIRIDKEVESLIMANDNSNKIYVLGGYKSEKRAKEVLQEIIDFYQIFKIYENCDVEQKKLDIIKLFKKENKKMFVYEMPEE